MSNTEQSALAMLNELQFPDIFQKIWQSQQPSRFCRQWAKPTSFFEERDSLIARNPRISQWVPLLESNRERIVAFDPASGKYYECYYDEADVEEIGSTYQQFLSWIFVELGYAGLSDLVEEVSESFCYRHLNAFKQFMAVDDDDSPDDSQMAFVTSIPD